MAGNEEEVLPETDKEEKRYPNLILMCSMWVYVQERNHCEKHINNNNQEQLSKICHKTFQTSIKALHHTAKEHSQGIIKNISVKEK